MATYSKKTWQSHEIINTVELQNMENGIAGAYDEIKALTDLMEINNYINRTFTNPSIILGNSGSTDPAPTTTITDLNTQYGSAIAVEIQNSGESTSLLAKVYGSIGELPYTTDPIKQVSITASNSATLFFITPPQDKIKIIIENQDSVNSTTINVVTRVLGNISFMIEQQYDSNADGTVNFADGAEVANHLKNGESSKTYSEISQEIDTDIATHAALKDVHHSSANDPTATQKSALAGTNGTPSSSNPYVTDSDSRMTNARTPTAHTHVVSSITDIAANYEPIISSKGTAFNKNFGSSTGTVCEGSDLRLTNTRSPTPHGDSHKSGGTDAIKLDELGTPTDVTTLDVTNAAHGLCPKCIDDTTKFLRSDGSWHIPSGTGGVAVEFGTTAGTCCEGNDPRLSDERNPALHSTSHMSGGSDPLSLDSLTAPTDNTLCNVSVSAHGLCPKLEGVATKFLRADGTWGLPNGGVPASHATAHKTGGTDAIKLDELQAPTDVTTLNASTSAHGLCPKLPNDNAKFLSGVGTWISPYTFGTTAGTVCQGDDQRLSDKRSPTVHASSHISGGSDPIALDAFAAPSDNTTLNASTTAHGLCPKLNGTSGTFLNGAGTWTTPAGTWASNFGTTAGTICQGNDQRLSDQRSPTVHSSSHSRTGTDTINIDDLGLPSDNTY